MRGRTPSGGGSVAALAAIVLSLTFAASADATLNQATMVRDTATASTLDPKFLIPFGSGVLFAGDTPGAGREPWFSDGTAAGTSMIKDINAGVFDGIVNVPGPDFTRIGNTVFFVADGDPASDIELWKTDGTAAGTVRVKDINPAGDSNPEDLTAVGSTLFFAADDGPNTELWRSDGTEVGTQMVADINPGPANSSNPEELVAVGNALYFSATDASTGDEPWISDGTAAGTRQVADIQPGVGMGSQPYEFTQLGSKVVFAAQDVPGNAELWTTNGTTGGTSPVTEINPAPATGSNPEHLTPFGSRIFLFANDGSTGVEIWQTDGTVGGTGQVIDLSPGPPTGADPANGGLVPFGSSLFFSGSNAGANFELWKTDGSSAGTSLAAEINPGPEGSQTSPQQSTPIGGSLFLAASDNDAIPFNNELWRSDGTPAGTTRVADIFPGPDGSFPDGLTAVGDVLFFAANDGVHNDELWLVDTAGPVATITGGPAEGEHIATPTPSFALQSSAPDLASFECSFDAATFAACDAGTVAGPLTAATSAPLADGPHSFAARGIDLRGHVGPSATRTFVVDTTAPQLELRGTRLRLNERGRARLRIRCPATELTGPCAGRLKVASRRRLSAGNERRKLKFRARSFEIGSGETERLGLRLSHNNLELLGDRDRVAMIAKATAADGLDNRGRVARRLDLRAPSR